MITYNGTVITGLDLLQAQQAVDYLQATDFKFNNGTLTAEQVRLRDKAKLLLEGSFAEPPSDLFDV